MRNKPSFPDDQAYPIDIAFTISLHTSTSLLITMGLLVLLTASMRGPLNQPARQHTVSHQHILTHLVLPLAMSFAIFMRFADSIASVGHVIRHHGLQPPTDLARLILHNLGFTDGDDVVVVGHPIYLFNNWGHFAPGHCLFLVPWGPPFFGS